MTRCKFKVTSKNEMECGFGVEMSAVMSGSEENKIFFKHTPNARFSLQSLEAKTAELFKVGKEYYIDISPAFEA